MEEIINVTGLKDYHGKEPGEKGKTRIENLEELISATRNYEQAFNEQDEARFAAEILKDWMNKGEMYQDSAILYRSNAQSRAIEEALLRANIPYRIYGGLRFYERLEIKNAISYLKIIFNHSDNPAFERSMGSPKGRGTKDIIKNKKLSQGKKYLLYKSFSNVVR